MFGRIKSWILRENPEQARLKELQRRGMKIGKDCAIYSGSFFDGNWPWLIEIGDKVTISTNVTILAHDASTNVVKCGTKLGRVRIGNNVFIGTSAIILCNTRIGDNVIVGAGSVVTHDLPSNGVYAGSPARRVCSIEEYREKFSALRETRPNMAKIRRWDEWKDATDEEKQTMIDALDDGFGFV